MADLPSERFAVNKPPFYNTGTDYFSPFFVKQGRASVKQYNCIFTSRAFGGRSFSDSGLFHQRVKIYLVVVVSSLFEGYPLQVRHKQDWGRGFILLLPQTAALPESDAGSGVIKPASSFVIQNRQTSCSMWCPMYRTRCYYMVCGLLRGTTLAIR